MLTSNTFGRGVSEMTAPSAKAGGVVVVSFEVGSIPTTAPVRKKGDIARYRAQALASMWLHHVEVGPLRHAEGPVALDGLPMADGRGGGRENAGWHPRPGDYDDPSCVRVFHFRARCAGRVLVRLDNPHELLVTITIEASELPARRQSVTPRATTPRPPDSDQRIRECLDLRGRMPAPATGEPVIHGRAELYVTVGDTQILVQPRVAERLAKESE